MTLNPTFEAELERFVKMAFEEDVRDGDHTSLACVPSDAIGKAKLLVKDTGVLAGVEIAKYIFKYLDKDFEIEEFLKDGAKIEKGDIAFIVKGKSQLILQAERLVLNTIQRMSGIATITAEYVDKIKNYPVQLLDTRKTTPNFRFLEKMAVRIGGGTNYRDGLYDRIMIKDNHTDFCGSLTQAITKVKNYLKDKNLNLPITVEVRNLEELNEVLAIGQIDRIMLDNFELGMMKEAVSIINKRFEVEASGGVNLSTIEAIAATGVDFISVGALTHSAQTLDLSLKEIK